MASDIQVTHEMGVSNDVQLGLSSSNGQPTPSLVVHAQNENKITYERKLRSWRKGLSYEPCKSAFVWGRPSNIPVFAQH